MAKFTSNFFSVGISCLMLFFSIESNSYGQNIVTVIGKGGVSIGNGGWDADGGPATSNQLNIPLGVALDASGNVYIVDASNRRIRKVTPSGIVSTVAGHPQLGSNYSASEGVVPTTIEYRSTMYDVAIDPSGNIYFTEMDRMRKITVATNLVNSYAGRSFANGYGGDGGLATAVGVQFRAMASISIDGSGNVYIADRDNRRIRMVTAATGIVTSVVGIGTNAAGGFAGDGGLATAAQIEKPHGLEVNSAGDIFFGDRDNSRIRKVIKSTGIITTIAGTGTVGYTGDGGLATAAKITYPTGVAVHPGNGDIYFVDQNNQCVRKITVSTGVITTVAGNQALGAGYTGDGGPATSAQLNFPIVTAGTATSPINLAVDASGNIYIPDRGNNVVRKVDGATGISTTFAGTGVGGYVANGGPGTSSYHFLTKGVATDASGNLYCIGNSNGGSQVRKLTTAGVITTVAGTGVSGYLGDGGLATAARIGADGIATDASGNLYIVEQNNSRIRKVDASTGIITTIAGTGTAGYSGDTGPATAAQIDIDGSDNAGIAVDGAGNIYFADGNPFNGTNYRIRKINSSGTITTIAGGNAAGFAGDGGLATAVGCQIDWPCQIALDASGNVYFASAQTGSTCIRKINVSTGIISTVAGNHTLASTGDGGLATAAAINSPRGVAIDASGNMYIAEAQGNCVRKVNTLGIISTIAGTGVAGFSGDGGLATAAQMNFPSAVALTNDGGCFFVADWPNNRVRKIDLGGSCPYLYVLPVNLLSFNLRCEKSDVICNWSTASEINNDYFTIERSPDGTIWAEAGIVKSIGNSSTIHNYEFTDDELPQLPVSGIFLYRIKQTDYDGKHEYFGPVAASCVPEDEWKLITETFVANSSVHGTLFAPKDAELTLCVIDMRGRVIKQETINALKGSNLLHIDIDNAGAGMYFVTLQNARVNLRQKFIKN